MKMHSSKIVVALALPFALLASSCGGGNESAPPVDPESGLTAFQLEHGIGPITEVMTVTEIDDVLADSGASSFNMKCAACHKLDERYVGPALRGVTERRSPTYIMNMILNPDEMIKTHPDARSLLAEYMTMMPNQNIQEAEARALLEHLRRSDAEAAPSNP
jgi:cytochrome c551/c552